MYHTLKKIVCVLTLALTVSGCSSGQPARISIESSQYETDTASVYTERPVFSFMADKTFQDYLNDEYEKDVTGKTVEFDTSDDGKPLEGGNKRVLEIKQRTEYNRGSLISIVSEVYIYTGGAHGQSVRSAKTADVRTGGVLKLSDLFADDGYEDELNRLIMEDVENHPEEYSELWEKPVIKDSSQTDFYLCENGLVIFYQPYDLSYYARGFVDFTIDTETISGFLKEEYRSELCKK